MQQSTRLTPGLGLHVTNLKSGAEPLKDTAPTHSRVQGYRLTSDSVPKPSAKQALIMEWTCFVAMVLQNLDEIDL